MLTMLWFLAAARQGCEDLTGLFDANGTYSEQAQIEMLIERPDGQKRSHTLWERLRYRQGITELLIQFSAPANLRQTGLLSIVQADGATDQWMYLPAFRRVRRVPQGDRRGSFLESDFSYEDLSAMPWQQVQCERAADQVVGGRALQVFETHTPGQDSAYAKRRLFIDPKTKSVVRIQFFATGDALVKELTNGQFKKVGKRWRPHAVQMRTVTTQQTTTLRYLQLQANASLTDADFTPDALQRQVAQN